MTRSGFLSRWLPAARTRAHLRRPGPGLSAVLLLAFLPALPGDAGAQEPVEARLRGVVTVGDPVTGLEGATVLLHRVDATEAGEIDSVFTATGGRFEIPLPGVPDPAGRQEVYFASVRHHGVLYFGSPIASAVQLDSIYRIQVFDTLGVERAPTPPALALRYMLVEDVGADGWQVTDLMQLEVAGRNTLVAGDDSVTWRYPLPPGVRNIRVGGSDVAGETAVAVDGQVSVVAPLTPGMRQVVLRYDIDSLAAAVPLPGGVPEMELLFRDEAPPLEVEGLLPTGSVALEDGILYRRYVGTDLPDTVVTFRATEGPGEIPMRWLAVVMALLFAGAAVVALKGRPGTRRPGRTGGEREALVHEIAQLDLALEETDDAGEVEALRARRRALVERLRGGA